MWKMLDKFIKLLILVGVGMIFLPSPTWAQVNINIPFALSNELGVEIIPNYPEPNTVVFINLTLYTDDLNSADINWYKDGKSVLSGKGETKYSFRMGGVGEETTIEIKIKLLSGASFSKSFTLNPASVNLVWEANSFVPPFYKGKALHPRQGGLKVVAMPEFVKGGKRVLPQNLIYQWSNGINVYQDQSGYGKSVIILNGSLLGRVENIEVLITDPVNNLVAQGFIDISPTDPEIVFYENSPYYGHLFDLAIENPFTLKSEEVQILVAPYYFSKDGGSSLIYKWRLNGQTIPDLSGSRTAVFRKPEDEKGQSVVSLQIENTSRVLQQADGSLIMNFSD
ncbi:MAG: hypothetical protein UT00_C0008G0002 [Parcubacteria group bacterium GW2011_GWA1_38_7]|nr:MAG: hypothetical protein UT00_C0008G0002 [Parcubacteria group bacterium GW2011_GWA1_38_7]